MWLLAFVALTLFLLYDEMKVIRLAHLRLELDPRPPAVRFTIGIAIFLAACSIASGFLAEAPMPRLPLFFAVVNLVAVAFALSPMGKTLSVGLPLSSLILFQGFRLPLELILHAWAGQGVIPTTMTWSGSNFDIVSGILAFVCYSFADKHRWVAWVFNVVGLGLLINVMRVAVMSSPLPFAWNVSPPLQLAFHVPYVLIAPVFVAGAFAGHLILLRALLRK